MALCSFFFFQAEDGIRDLYVTGVQTCALPICIVCGHLHRPIVRRFAGTVACTAPATAHQIALDLGETPRLATVMEPPGCLLHLWLGDSGGLVTHVSLIGDR